MTINKITGSNFNSFNLAFQGKNGRKGDTSTKIIDLREKTRLDEASYIMDYGKPSKVVFVYDKDKAFATAKLFNKKDRCFYEVDVPDEQIQDCKDVLINKGVDEQNIWEVTYGGLAYEEGYVGLEEGGYIDLSGLDALGTKEQAAAKRAILDMVNRKPSDNTVLKAPVVFNDNDEIYKMGYYTFLARTYGTDFDFLKVMDNLNKSTLNSFTEDDIDCVIVVPDGTMMEVRTKDGKRAFMDFNTGERRVYGGNPDASGYGTIMLMDDFGPVIRKPEPKKTEKTEKKEKRKAVNENESLSSKLLGYFGIGRNKKHSGK